MVKVMEREMPKRPERWNIVFPGNPGMNHLNKATRGVLEAHLHHEHSHLNSVTSVTM